MVTRSIAIRPAQVLFVLNRFGNGFTKGNQNPALGSGIVPVFAYIFGTDHSSHASVLGAAGLVTDNGSRALAFAGELYFNRNTYRSNAAYLRGNLNYDLYGLGSGDLQERLPLKQEGQAVFAELLRGSSLITVKSGGTGALHEQPAAGIRRRTLSRSLHGWNAAGSIA